MTLAPSNMAVVQVFGPGFCSDHFQVQGGNNRPGIFIFSKGPNTQYLRSLAPNTI